MAPAGRFRRTRTEHCPRFLPTIGHPHAVALHFFTRCNQLVTGLAPGKSAPMPDARMGLMITECPTLLYASSCTVMLALLACPLGSRVSGETGVCWSWPLLSAPARSARIFHLSHPRYRTSRWTPNWRGSSTLREPLTTMRIRFCRRLLTCRIRISTHCR